MPIDGVKSTTISATSQPKPVEAPKPPPPPPPPAALKPTEGFDTAKPKPVSITGKFKPLANGPAPAMDQSFSMKGMMNVVNAGGSTNTTMLTSTNDKEIREAIIKDPSVLDGVSAQRKGEMLEELREGYTSDGDKHAMQFIVKSCKSKEELRDVMKAANGGKPATQAEFHKFDKELTNYHPYLIADSLNPANTSLPEKPLPPPSNLPDALKPGNAAEGPFKNERNENVDYFKTGDNTTKVPRGALDATPAEIETRKAAQTAQLDEMKKTLGRELPNPPSVSDARDYFQKVSGNGTPAEMKDVQQKYGDYLKNFYVHAGQGVDWGAGKNLANDVQKSFDMQPQLADGRRVIDCEGFSALNESILGKVQDKSGKPMFDVMHVANGEHVMSGVFRRGQPLGEGAFMVNNDKVRPITQEDMEATKKLAANDRSANKDFNIERVLTAKLFELEMKKPADKKGRTLDSMK